MGDVGLPLGRASRGGGEAACEGGVGEAAWLSVLAIEARRLCVLLGASKLSRGVCFPEETVLPLAGSLDGGELCGWFETAMAAMQWSDCQSDRPCGVYGVLQAREELAVAVQARRRDSEVRRREVEESAGGELTHCEGGGSVDWQRGWVSGRSCASVSARARQDMLGGQRRRRNTRESRWRPSGILGAAYQDGRFASGRRETTTAAATAGLAGARGQSMGRRGAGSAVKSGEKS